jgi:phosphoenolpyruvate phosphomutase
MQSRNKGRVADFVTCSQPNSKRAFLEKVTLKDFVGDGERADVTGEWMGFLKVSDKGAAVLKAALEKLEKEDKTRFDSMKMPDLLRQLVKDGAEIRVLYTTGHWLDVDSVEDVVLGASF